MAICSFIGHRDIYDADIADRLQKAVDEVVSRNEAVDFWFHPQGEYNKGEYFNYCLLAVLRAKNRSSNKINICLVVDEQQYAKFMQQSTGSIPACMVDKITMYHMDDIKSSDLTMPYKKFVRYIVQQSSYVISCIYERLYEPESQILHFARKQPNLEVISVTSPETEQKIMEYEGALDERERRVLQKMKEDSTLKEAGAVLGVGRERARQIAKQGCHTIRKKLEQRYKKESEVPGQMNRSCAVFSLGKGTYEAMNHFKLVTNFLAEKYHVRTIYIEHHYAHSGFMIVLKQMQPCGCDLHVTAVTDEYIPSENSQDNDDLNTRYCPPCDATKCVTWPCMEDNMLGRSVIADMVERSDFCIFDYSSAPCIEQLKQYISPKNQTVFLDIGKTDVIKAD